MGDLISKAKELSELLDSMEGIDQADLENETMVEVACLGMQIAIVAIEGMLSS